MRRSALLAGALLTAATPALAQVGAAPVRPDYVPDGIWRDEGQAQFLERWFGDQLHAMREPVLSHPGGLGPYRRRFRMLVLPHYSPGYAIRVDESATGGRMRLVRLDGNGGWTPGRIARQRLLTLSREEMRALNTIIRTSGVAGMAAEPPAYEQPPPDPVTGEQTIQLCHHATYFVFELVAGGESRFVVRDACEMPDGLRTLIEELREARLDAGLR
jgi:hypothetical protein